MENATLPARRRWLITASDYKWLLSTHFIITFVLACCIVCACVLVVIISEILHTWRSIKNESIWFTAIVFNTTFNDISVISWRSVLLVEESGVPGENHLPAASHSQLYHIMLYRVHHAWMESINYYIMFRSHS